MGVVLQFPGSGAGEGAGDDPASSARSGQDDAGPEPPRWAVPGVDDAGDDVAVPASAPVEPVTRAAKRASNVALAALTRHDASEAELRATLTNRGLDEGEVEAELDRLKRSGLVDDAALATRLIASLRERKGLGDAALKPALRARKIPQEVVEAVLAEHPEDDGAAEERLQEVADARARRLGSLPFEVAERRLTAFLMRKGYGGSAVRTAARTALEHAGLR